MGGCLSVHVHKYTLCKSRKVKRGATVQQRNSRASSQPASCQPAGSTELAAPCLGSAWTAEGRVTSAGL
jgi:hypothetical protein